MVGIYVSKNNIGVIWQRASEKKQARAVLVHDGFLRIRCSSFLHELEGGVDAYVSPLRAAAST